MKAYIIHDRHLWDGAAVVFAETSGKAKAHAVYMDEFEGAEFIDLSARRAPKLDKYYKGATEMDWYDNEDRIAMVREAGFHCDMSECGIDDYFCRTCVANEWCSEYQDILKEEERCHSVNHAEPR